MLGAWRTIARYAAGSALGLLLFACASGTHPEPEVGDIPIVLDAGDVALPLDAYDHTTDGYRALVQAQAKLANECLSRFGVESPIVDVSQGDLPRYDRLNERRYGLFDLVAAESRGYNASSDMGDEDHHFSSLEEVDEFRRQQGRWSTTETESLLLDGRSRAEDPNRPLPVDSNGDPLPEDGCRGEAQRIVTSGTTDPLWPSNAGMDSFHRAENDSRVQAAVAEWSDCMTRKGYGYSSIWEPNDRDWPEPVTEEEINTAVADVECKRETNLVGIWFAVESAYQRQFIEENAGRLAELKTWLETVYRNAARVLAQVE